MVLYISNVQKCAKIYPNTHCIRIRVVESLISMLSAGWSGESTPHAWLVESWSLKVKMVIYFGWKIFVRANLDTRVVESLISTPSTRWGVDSTPHNRGVGRSSLDRR